MKDYLSNEERINIIIALKSVITIDALLKTNLFLKSEQGDLKRSCTYLIKSITEGVLQRLNPSAIKTFNNTLNGIEILAVSKHEMATYEKKKSSNIEASYEENKDYFKLVELILFYNCKGCNRSCNQCEIYREFEDKCIPNLDGVKYSCNCKYSYQ